MIFRASDNPDLDIDSIKIQGPAIGRIVMKTCQDAFALLLCKYGAMIKSDLLIAWFFVSSTKFFQLPYKYRIQLP